MIKLVEFLQARFLIMHSKMKLDRGRVTYQGIYFKIGELTKVDNDEFVLSELRRLLSKRFKTESPANLADVVIRDSLNQLASILPSNTNNPKQLIDDMITTSYQSMEKLVVLSSQTEELIC